MKCRKKPQQTKQTMIEAYDSRKLKGIPDNDNPLDRVNELCNHLQHFLSSHSGFDRDDIQDYLNLFSVMVNPIYKDVTFGILGAGKSATYAADYHLDDYGKPVRNKIEGLDGVPGFTVSAFGQKAGFGFNGQANADKYAVLAHAETKSLDLAEGVTAQAAAGMKITEASKAFGLSAKAAYDFVSLDVYFFSVDGFETNVLVAKLAAKKAVTETVTVGGSAEIINALADAREVKLGANVKAAVAPVTIEADVSYAIKAKTVGANAKVTYTVDMFTAYGKLSAGMSFANEFAMTKNAPEVGVSTTKVVDSAELSLRWKGADFAETANKKGAIAAKATISL